MSDPRFDGLCGIPCPSPQADGTYMRCTFEVGHETDQHSWENRKHTVRIGGCVTRNECLEGLNPLPEGCTCRPLRDADTREILDYVFSPTCPVH